MILAKKNLSWLYSVTLLKLQPLERRARRKKDRVGAGHGNPSNDCM